MRSNKGRRKKVGAFFYSILIHLVLVALLAFPFLTIENKDQELIEGLIIQFDNQRTVLPLYKTQKPKNLPQRKVNNNSSDNPNKKAAETNVLKPKLESATKVTKVKPIPKSIEQSTNETVKATPENLETQHTLTEKRRDHFTESEKLAEDKAELKKQRLKAEREAELLRKERESAAQKAKYEKMQDAFSQLLKNANHETPSNSPSFDLYDKSLDQPAESTTGKDAESITNRKVIFIPQIEDNSQKEGRVVVKICVDATGAVTKARYTQLGSTTTDSYLIDLAVKNARKYKFAPYSIEEQCGRVNIDFEVR